MPKHPVSIILAASAFAAHKHRDQRRNGADASPYINHPIAVANVLANEAGITENTVLAAALLHDTIEGNKTAIAAGVDSIEHGSFLQDDTLLEMKKKHVYLVPTLFAGAWTGEHADGYPPVIAAKARAAAAQSQQMFQHAVKIGVPVAMGTDAGVEPHGLNAREFSLMTKNGMPPAEALMAGTAHAAELLGVAEQIGTLQPGKLADVIALAGIPLTDLKATEHAVFVMKEGVIYRNAALPQPP